MNTPFTFRPDFRQLVLGEPAAHDGLGDLLAALFCALLFAAPSAPMLNVFLEVFAIS